MGKNLALGTHTYPNAVGWSQQCEVVTRCMQSRDGFTFAGRWFSDGFGGRKDNGLIASTGQTGFPDAANRSTKPRRSWRISW